MGKPDDTGERSGPTGDDKNAEGLPFRRVGATGILLLPFVVLLVFGASVASAAPPSVTIDPAPTPGYSSVEVSGEVDPGSQEVTLYAEYRVLGSESRWTEFLLESIEANIGPSPVSGTVTGLAPDTTYEVRLDAYVPGEGEFFSPEPNPSFTTEPVVPPNATLEAPTALTSTTAHFSGTVDPNAPEPAPASPDVEAAFETSWRILCTPECQGDVAGETLPGQGTVPADDVAHPVEGEAVGLLPGTSYEVSLVARNGGGEEVGGPVTFETPPAPPAIDAVGVGGIGEAGASLESSVRPNGAATSVHFDYLSEAEYLASGEAFGNGTASTPETVIGSDDQQHAVSAMIEGLAPLTPYVFRAVASNSVETTTSAPRRFVTFGAASLGLPDGRAYEQVTPVNKNGSNAQGFLNEVKAAPDGSGITFFSQVGFPGAEGAQNFGTFLATRAPDGSAWSTQGLLPPAMAGPAAGVNGWTEDLTDAFDTAAQPGRSTFYLRDNVNRSLRPIATSENEFSNFSLADSTATGSTVVFESTSKLLPEALEFQPNVYVWDKPTGTLRLGALLNSGLPPGEGAAAGPYDWFLNNLFAGGASSTYYTQDEHVLAADGSSLVFTALGSGQLFVRRNPTQAQNCGDPLKACTYQVSEPNSGVTDPIGEQPAAFVGASNDGTRIFFISSQHLTADANTGSGDQGRDLYVYDFGKPDGERLTDLTPDTEAGDPNGAEVKGVLGTSADGSYVYFAAAGVLAPGAGREDCEGNGEAAAERLTGTCNLYIWHAGQTSFVSRLETTPQAGTEGSNDLDNWRPRSYSSGSLKTEQTARVTPDGRTLLFRSRLRLDTFDNEEHAELYRFQFGDVEPVCVSCDPSGAAPVGSASLFDIGVAASPFPEPSPILTRNLSESGDQVFFESPDKLVPSDTNGDEGCPVETGSRSCQDVYEWEAAGTPGGSCTRAEVNGGCLYLISTGKSPDPSYFADADLKGKDAFFFTSESLVGQDRDQLVDIYDARVDGGIASQNPPPPSSCEGEDCKEGGTAPPSAAFPGTSGFHGAGNVADRCSSYDDRAKQLAGRAKRLRRTASRAHNPGRAKRLHRKARHLTTRARHSRHRARQCRQPGEAGHPTTRAEHSDHHRAKERRRPDRGTPR